MAEIEIEMSKAAVTYRQPGLWNINMHLTATDEGVIVIDADYSAEFRKGDVFVSKSKELTIAIQTDIDTYYSERFISRDKDLDILVTTVEEGLDLSEPTELDEVRGRKSEAVTR